MTLIVEMKDSEEPRRLSRYDRIENVPWENCARVLTAATQMDARLQPWHP
jgi:hypothetical protein